MMCLCVLESVHATANMWSKVSFHVMFLEMGSEHRTQVFRLAQQVCYLLNHLTNQIHFS